MLFYFGFVLFFGEEGVFVEGIRPLLQLKSILKTMPRSPESHLYSWGIHIKIDYRRFSWNYV